MNMYTNLQKRAISLLMIMVLCVGILPTKAFAAEETINKQGVTTYSTGKTIYTEFTGGNSSHSGDGSDGK